MNTLLNEHDDDVADTHHHGGRRDREITLGTSMVLGIFFCLAAICAVFFGFGYSIGRKSVTSVIAGEQTGSLTFNSFKPAPGSPVGAPLPGTTSPVVAAAPLAAAPLPPPAATRIAPTAKMEAADAAARAEAVVTSAAVPAAATEKAAEAPRPAPAPVPPAAQPAASGGAALVQVAAVSHQEDADMLVSTLKRRGYAVAIHSEPQDKLMHVQIGPFLSRKDAEAMRLRLQNDGFNAIVK